MSKITNDGLTRSGTTGRFIAVPVWAQWASKGYYIRTLALQFRRADAHAVYGGVHVTRRINFRYDLDV